MSNLPLGIYGDKKVIHTRDGSFSFYSLSYLESYKTKSVGAYCESRHKFVEAGKVVEKCLKGDVRILDICFGFGMNLAVTIDEYLKSGSKNKLHIVSVEKDHTLIGLVNKCGFLFPYNGYKVLRELLTTGRCGNISLELYLDDALKFINLLQGTFDAIYFDPFSAKHNPEMWSMEVFDKIKSILSDNGSLMTYASNKALREMLTNIGFHVTKVSSIGGRNHPSVVCYKKFVL